MSTFKGIVEEFPHIRIDYFRHQPGRKAPLACFLSHVHSDHLVGLESLRAPFVYCSAATREILLRLEKHHYRANFARGIVESRNVTYDRSMRKLAKPLPLDTPTAIELAPGNEIQVCLLEANHCVGAVMFLIQGDGKAVLYTGDVRAEPWWVNSLVQNPLLLPYACGSKRLDCMYLDTTFATKSKPYRDFPSKAGGIKELLEKVQTYPSDTIFYFHAWTFGYENVLIALSNFLASRIHLDDYRAGIYGSLSTLDKRALREGGLHLRNDNKPLRESGLEVREAPALCGFRNGNHIQPGCLTSRPDVRIHSCERGTGCPVMDDDEEEARVVHIIPIVNRHAGHDIIELGAGGGKGDLDQREELETSDMAVVEKLIDLCAKTITDAKLLSKVQELLKQALDDGKATIDVDVAGIGGSQENEGNLSVQQLVSLLSFRASTPQECVERTNRTIRFPYSRHSSFFELCGLVDAFRPKDVFPCTVDGAKWDPEMSMRNLFGAFCSEDIFRHDAEMMQMYESRLEQGSEIRRNDRFEQETQRSDGIESNIVVRDPRTGSRPSSEELDRKEESSAFLTPVGMPEEAQELNSPVAHRSSHVVPALLTGVPPSSVHVQSAPSSNPPHISPSTCLSSAPLHDAAIHSPVQPGAALTSSGRPLSSAQTARSLIVRPTAPHLPKYRQRNRRIAYEAALGRGYTWIDHGGLVSAKDMREGEEMEL